MDLSENGAIKLMQQRLLGAESDTKDLAKMLVDLGICPSAAPYNDTSPFAATKDIYSTDVSRLAAKPIEKSVRFEPNITETKEKSFHRPSILKKSTIAPLKVNLNSLNMNPSELPVLSSEQYSKLVSRLCKTESIIQSLKLSLCSIQTSHEASDREKSLVIDKLKEEITDQEIKLKKQDEDMLIEQGRLDEYRMRWEGAEEDLKDLHNRLQEQSQKNKLNATEEEITREKVALKLEEAKKKVARETEIRVAIENSHISLLSRVEDMEQTIQHERSQGERLREENKKLREANDDLLNKTRNFHIKANDLEQTLITLKDELNAKEEAIRRLVDEQHRNEVESSSLANQQASLCKEVEQCNIVLEAQKAAFVEVEAENTRLKQDLSRERRRLEEKERNERAKEEDNFSRRNEEQLRIKELEEHHKMEIKKIVKTEKKRFKELEERNKLLEQCINEQEHKIKEKEEELTEREKEQNEKLLEERKKTSRAKKEAEMAIKARETLMKDLNRATSDVELDREFLQQQLEEAKLEQEAMMKERYQMEEENQRLLNRVSSIEQQEQAYKRAQDIAHASNAAKSQLAYENGRLQTRVEQLEEELRSVASAQSQVVQLRTSNRALEQKFSQLSNELATTRVDLQRSNAHIKQLQSGMERKEEDFNLALAARDEAVQEKEAALTQVEIIKEQEKNKQNLFKRDLADCRADNDRLTATMDDVTSQQAELQNALNEVQGRLGRKDMQISVLTEEKNKKQLELNELQGVVTRLQSTLQERDSHEESRFTPALEALEKARQDNVRLATSLDDVMTMNDKLKEEMEKSKINLEIQRERNNGLVQQQENKDNEVAVMSQTHEERLKQLKEQFARERSAIKKQNQAQLAELKKSQESTQTRNSQITKGNAELRGKLADKERSLAKLKEKLKEQKGQIERWQRQRKLHVNAEEKIKAIDVDLVELENTKKSYMEKNAQQSQIISTFNQEMVSLQGDITALSQAQKVARETTLRLETDLTEERSEKQVLINKIQTIELAMKKAIREKQVVEEKLRKVEVESVKVQENLQEAQSWFQNKFEALQNELVTK